MTCKNLFQLVIYKWSKQLFLADYAHGRNDCHGLAGVLMDMGQTAEIIDHSSFGKSVCCHQDMETKTTHSFPKSASQKTERHVCPQCNTDMIVAEQCRENGFLFIWYECTRDGCDGQWLEKKSESNEYHETIDAEELSV